MNTKRVLNALCVILITSLCLGTAQAQDDDSPETLAEQDRARAAEAAAPAEDAPSAAPGPEGAGDPGPLFIGVDDATVDAFRVNIDTNAFTTAFSGVEVWGSAYDAINDRVLFNDGSVLWEWPVGGVPNMLGTITNVAGAAQAMVGLAWYDGTLYGTKNIANEAIWEIDPSTQVATVHIDYVDAEVDCGGFSVDQATGEFYCTNDDSTPHGSGLVIINPDATVTHITAYPAGENDVDGLAVGTDGRAYLVTDDPTPQEIYVWNLAAGAYDASLVSPWTTSELFSAGAWISGEGGGGEPQPARATFGVQKIYFDLNPTPVEVTLSCNTGLPLEQTTTLEPDPTGEEYIEFVVNDFADGELDCEITESVPAGYYAIYLWFEEGEFFQGEEGCFFENVAHGDFADTTEGQEDNFCIVLNVPEVSTVTVTKEWIDEGMQFTAPNYAEASWFCSNLPDIVGGIILPPLAQPPVLSSLAGNGNTASGNLEFIGNPGVDSFFIIGNWDGGTMCDVTEQVVEGGVETDDSDCQGLVIGPGEDVACTIVNTRLFEGIPTLSQYGLGLLALLMLGMGFVAYRRVV